MNAHEIIHHQWKPPELVDDLSSYDAKVENMQKFTSEPETYQVVSFPALNFECYEFDNGGLGKKNFYLDRPRAQLIASISYLAWLIA